MQKGSLLIVADNLEIDCIPEKERDQTIWNFHVMKLEAERQHDCFYVMESVFSHQFSYGCFYPDFVQMSWSEFRACDSLRGISQTTFQAMQSFCQRTVDVLTTGGEFLQKVEPRAFSGYKNSTGEDVFVNDIDGWEEWHRDWYVSHQEQIEWRDVTNKWFPRPDIISQILRRELISCLGEEEARKIDEADVAIEFHNRVMRRKGPETEAYAMEVGREICERNYYVFESELSTLEQSRAGSLRRVFSIINQGGRLQFVSIDFLHGMFEFLNERGQHLGEFHFDGSYNSVVEEDHSLRCLDLWHRRTGR